ncbi:MAG: protoheme IX farnesyltransferase [Bacteroidia bacterium]|nr:protoheme IX farnesyltransferase [Bacteroidia bacterium]
MLLSQVKTISFESQSWLSAKLSDYGQFIKLRLSGLVVFSACIGYLLGLNGSVEWGTLFIVLLGGMLVTASSNGFNQVIERDTDKLMNRTSDRPLPAGRMNASEGIIAAFLLGAAGIWMLWVMVNPLTGFLSLISLLLYTLAYTPLKKVTPLAVFVGAIPGAMPPLIGWVAATGNIGPAALALYALQFIWQFPHFWSLAWVLDEDYQRAGFKMLPSPDGKGKRTAFQTMVYTLSLIPLALLPQLLGIGNIYSTVILVVCGIYFSHQAFQLYRQCTDDMARRLMFGSFFYLPVTQIALLIGKMFS